MKLTFENHKNFTHFDNKVSEIRYTVGFKYKGHKVFGDFGQMSLFPGWTLFSILSDPNYRKLTKNIFILYLNMRQASCMLVYDLI